MVKSSAARKRESYGVLGKQLKAKELDSVRSGQTNEESEESCPQLEFAAH